MRRQCCWTRRSGCSLRWSGIRCARSRAVLRDRRDRAPVVATYPGCPPGRRPSGLLGEIKQRPQGGFFRAVFVETAPRFRLLRRIIFGAVLAPGVPYLPCPGLPGAVQRHPDFEPAVVVDVMIGQRRQGINDTRIIRGPVPVCWSWVWCRAGGTCKRVDEPPGRGRCGQVRRGPAPGPRYTHCHSGGDSGGRMV